MSRARAPSGFAALLAVCVLAGFALRFAWPLADPPESMSWSSSPYTDPPQHALAARYATEGGAARAIVVPEQWIYPGLHGIARAAYAVFGPRRIATVLAAAVLGAMLVALLALLARRIAGELAGALTAILAATSAWFVPDSRLLLGENVAIVFMVGAALAAMSRRRRVLALAGALAAAAGFFGKYHALAFLPVLAWFLARRDGRASLAAATGGALLVGVVWLTGVYLPHADEILGFLRESSPALALAAGDSGLAERVLTPFAALQQSWLVPRMTIVFFCAALFLMRALGRPAADGTGLLAMWALVCFVATAVLPYRAPRYFTFVAAPLLLAAACQIAAWLRPPHGDAPPRSGLLWRCAAATIFAFAAIELAARVEAGVCKRFFLEEWVLDPSRPETFSRLRDAIGGLPGHALASLVAGIAVGAGSALRPAARRMPVATPVLAALVLVAAVGTDLVRWVDWARHRSTTIEDAKAALPHVVGRNAVLLGAFAPLLTEGSGIVAHPQFGTLEPEDADRRPPITHLVLLEPDIVAFDRVLPEFVRGMRLVQQWPIRAVWAKSVALFVVPDAKLPPDYAPSAYEEAVRALEQGRLDEARAKVFSQRAAHGPNVDADLLEAVILHASGDVASARLALERAVAARPNDAVAVGLLAQLAQSGGDLDAAEQLWMRAVALAPGDRAAVARAGELLRRTR